MRSVRNESSVVKTNRLYAFIDGFEKDKLYIEIYKLKSEVNINKQKKTILEEEQLKDNQDYIDLSDQNINYICSIDYFKDTALCNKI